MGYYRSTKTSIIEKYRNTPRQVKASFWFVISNVMIRGISFITMPIFTEMLTTSQYGVVSVYQSWVTVVSIITTLTIWGGVFNVGMVKYGERKYEMISSFQGLAVTLTCLAAVISFGFLPILQRVFDMSPLLIACMYLEILSQIPFFLWSTEQRYKYEYKSLVILTLLIGILSPVLSVIAVINTENKAEAKIVCGMLVQLIVGVFFFIINQYKGKKFFCIEFWKFGFSFNIVLVPHYLSMQILSQSDRIMIKNLCGSSDAGIYSVAYNFAMLLSLITSGINSSLTPHIYECMKSGNVKKLKSQVTSVVLIVAVLTLCLVSFIPDIFYLLLPESYYEALKVIPPVAAGAFFLFLYPLFGAIEFYYEENRYITIASLIGAVLNVLLNYVFINIFGFIAAAYTTLFCYVCFCICHYLFMKLVMKKRGNALVIYDIKSITIISFVVLVGSILMVLVYDSICVRWIIITLILIALICKRKSIFSIFTSLIRKEG